MSNHSGRKINNSSINEVTTGTNHLRDKSANLFRLLEPARPRTRSPLSSLLVCYIFGINIAGRYNIARNIFRTVSARNRFCKDSKANFRRRIRGNGRISPHRVTAGCPEKHYAPIIAAGHSAESAGNEISRKCQIQTGQITPVGHVHPGERRLEIWTEGADQNVDRLGGNTQNLGIFKRTNLLHDQTRLNAARSNPLDKPFSLFPIMTAVNDQPGAKTRNLENHRPADTAGTAHNERGLSLQIRSCRHDRRISHPQDLDKARECCYTRWIMKRNLLVLLIFFGSIAMLFAANQKDFDNTVNFSLNIEQIDTLVSQSKQAQIDRNRYLILNGAVASIEIIRPDEKDFLALVELVSGKWTGLEKVSLYRVYVILSGPEYFKRLPAQPPRTPEPGMIAVNDKILVVGTFADVGQAPDGKMVAVIRGDKVRLLQ